MVNSCRLILIPSLIATLAVAGCRSNSDADAQAEADRKATELRRHAKWEEQPTGVTPQPVAVAQGPTPLIHLFDIGGPVRVVDMTTQARLASADVPAQTLVRIDDRNGVTIGTKNLVPGPLPAGHVYTIYLDPQTPNVMRQGVGPAREFQP